MNYYQFTILNILLIFFSCEKNTQQIYDQSDVITIDSTKNNRNILIIGIDGYRSDVMQELISPFLFDLTRHDNTYYNLEHITEEITYSGPNWSSILTGVHTNKHNVTNNNFDNDRYNYFPPLFNYIENANNNINTYSIVNWTPINKYILSDFVDYSPELSINDSIVYEMTKNLILNSDTLDSDVIFIHFDEPDGAGHNYGFSPSIEEYTNTINRIDFYSNSLYNIIEEKRQNGEDWLFIVISDHGGDGTAHGDATNPNINRTIFFVNHPEEILKTNCCYISNMTDLAPTVLNFLGIKSNEFNFQKDGNSIIIE